MLYRKSPGATHMLTYTHCVAFWGKCYIERVPRTYSLGIPDWVRWTDSISNNNGWRGMYGHMCNVCIFFSCLCTAYHAGYVTKVNMNSETNKLKSDDIDVDPACAVPHVPTTWQKQWLTLNNVTNNRKIQELQSNINIVYRKKKVNKRKWVFFKKSKQVNKSKWRKDRPSNQA